MSNDNNNYRDEDLAKVEFEEQVNTEFDNNSGVNFEIGGSKVLHIKEEAIKLNDEFQENLTGIEHKLQENEELCTDNQNESDDISKANMLEISAEDLLGDDMQSELNEKKSDSLYTDSSNEKKDIGESNEGNVIRSPDNVCESIETTLEDVTNVGDIGDKCVPIVAHVHANDPDNFVDILGNSLLTKRVLSKGLGRESRPTHGNSVTISYKAWNSQDILFEDKVETFVIGDGDMVQAFDLALCLAEIQEEFELKTDSRFAYGEHGLPPFVQANEALRYHIKLLAVDDAPDYAAYTYDDRMAAADKKRERGNYLYRRGEFSYAVNSYARVIKILETDPDFKKAYTDPSKADMFDLFVKATNNLAASQLKLESFDSVIESCDAILSYDGNNVKALFRKGKALSMKGSYEEAIVILKKAFELENNNKLIATEIQKCQQLKRVEAEQQARLCKKMFGNNGADSANKCQQPSTMSAWKKMVYKYSPYIGAVLVTGLSIFLATVAINKSKGT